MELQCVCRNPELEIQKISCEPTGVTVEVVCKKCKKAGDNCTQTISIVQRHEHVAIITHNVDVVSYSNV